jgi:hypothetical protein
MSLDHPIGGGSKTRRREREGENEEEVEGSAIDMGQSLLNPPYLVSQRPVMLQSVFQSRARLGDGGAGDVEVTAYVRAGKGRMLPRKVKCVRPVGICTVPERDGPIASS